MRLGRRDPTGSVSGDALDFWRVEDVRRPGAAPPARRDEAPGRAWLQYEVMTDSAGSRLVQTAFFEPKGLPGLAYWYLLYPAHGLIFRGMIRVLAPRKTDA